MDIVIAANFCRDFSPTDNGRFLYLAKMLSENHEVEIVTSDFYHATKKFREELKVKWPFKITYIHELGYKKNVDINRLLSHYILGKNFLKYLKRRKKPDVIYCAVPSLDFADAARKYCKKNGVKFIIDIQDLWPEAFKMAFNIPVLSDVIFAPMQLKANKIYKAADHIVAVSKTYAERAKQVNKTADTTVVLLGTEMKEFDSYICKGAIDDNKIKIAYIGSLSNSYDIENVIRAIDKLPDKNNIKFIVMGDGVLKQRFEEFAKQFSLDIEFTGRLDYPQMVERLCKCDIAVNPIVKGSAGSVINKVGDYAMAALPVINTQECKEYRNLIEEYGAGINCECGNADDISNAILTLCENNELRKKMGEGNRKMAIEKFDRAKTYGNIVRVITDESFNNQS